MSRRTVEISFRRSAAGLAIVAMHLVIARAVIADPLPAAPLWTADGQQTDAAFGAYAATAGDVNGDGCADVLVGAPFDSHGEYHEGRARLYLGSSAGPAATPAWTAESNQPNALFGWFVRTAGDVNGDGYADVLIGALQYTRTQPQEGAVFLYLGSPAGLSPSPDWTAFGDEAGALLSACGTAGDVNGDGYDDVVIGANRYTGGQTHEGRAWLYLGSAAGLQSAPAWMNEGGQAEANFGSYVATAGDVNADGFDDVIVGAEHYDAGGLVDEGRAYVYLGSAAGLAASPVWVAGSGQANSHFSASVESAGDVNGDGYDDVVVTAHLYHDPEPAEGAAFVYLGSAGGPGAAPSWRWESNQESAQVWPALGAGDVNGDGYADVIVGSDAYDDGETDEGRAFLFLGSPAGLEPAPAWSVEGNQPGAYLGYSVGTAGDVNGDGFPDVIIGATRYDGVVADGGRVWIYAGEARTSVASPVTGGRRSHVRIAPNPASGAIRVGYDLPRAGRVRASVFDLEGRLVQVLCDARQSAGPHDLAWNGGIRSGRTLPAGVYLVRIEAPGFAEGMRVVLLR